MTMNSELSLKFLNGTYTLVEGRHIQPDDSYAALISKELADKNGLSVGDDIAMYDLDSDSENTFTIVGIFSGTEGMSKDAMMADEIPANQGYIDMNSYQKMWNETALELGSWTSMSILQRMCRIFSIPSKTCRSSKGKPLSIPRIRRTST